MIFGDILDSITTMNKGQLDSVVRAVRNRRAIIAQAAKASFYPGAKITWRKQGRSYYGTVTKVCQKNLKARATDGTTWTIYPPLATKVKSFPEWA